MRIQAITAALVVTLGMYQMAGANDIRHVFVVDDMTIELEMKEPLTEDETAPKNYTSDTYQPPLYSMKASKSSDFRCRRNRMDFTTTFTASR